MGEMGTFKAIRVLAVTVIGLGAAIGAQGGIFDRKVIYGDDNRLDVYQVSDPATLKLADSTVALIKDSQISVDGKIARIETDHYGKNNDLCTSERFYDQPEAAFCSGSLIGPDLVLTAGHCVEDEFDCEEIRLVFGFAVKKKGQYPSSVPASEVYSCKEILDRDDDDLDFALIRLDRPVVNHAPLTVDLTRKVTPGTRLTVIGHPSGIPTKIAGGATVREVLDEGYFTSSLDTYAGNSGSSVFDSKTGAVVGVLVRGATDFVPTDQGCKVSNRCAEDDCRGEDSTSITAIRDRLVPYLYSISMDDAAITLDVIQGRGEISTEVRNLGNSVLTLPLEATLEIKDEIKARQVLTSLAPGRATRVRLPFDGLDPVALATTGVPATLRLSVGETIIRTQQVELRGKSPWEIAVSNVSAQVEITEGTASIFLQVTNTSSQSTGMPVVLTVIDGGNTIGRHEFGALQAGQSSAAQVNLCDLDPERLYRGIAVKLQLQVGSLTLFEGVVELKGRYGNFLSFGKPQAVVDLPSGSGELRLVVKNTGQVASTSTVLVSVTINERSEQLLVPVLQAGKNQELRIHFGSVDPFAAIKNGLKLSVHVTDGKLVLFRDSVTFTVKDTLHETIRYFDALANERGFVPAGEDRALRLNALRDQLAAANAEEVANIQADRSNPYAIRSGQTVLGRVVSQYLAGTQTSAGRTQYRLLGLHFWEARKILRKGLLTKGSTRKSYEGLCRELPI